MSSVLIWIFLISFIVIVIYIAYRKNFKKIKAPAVCLITGAPKTGKSLLSVKLSIKQYRKVHRIWWIKTKIFRKKLEEPLYYTNVAISFGNLKSKRRHRLDKNIYSIDLRHLTRDIRFNYGSVIYIQESSLLSDCMDIKDNKRNAEMSMFSKLIAHETKGGMLYLDTQNSLDNHYSFKRVSNVFYMIQKNLNFILFRVLYVRELVNDDLGTNNFVDDVDTTTRKVLIWRWWYKKYDRYYFSYLTDNLKCENNKLNKDNGLISFNPLYRELSKKGDK